MLTANDLKQIGKLLHKTEEKLDKKLDKVKGDLEYKMESMEERLEKKIDEAKEETIKAVADYFADSVLPLLDKHDARIERLEQHTTHPPISANS